MYCLNVCLTIWYEMQQTYEEYALKDSVTAGLIFCIVAVTIYGGFKEGIRTSQWASILLFTILVILIVFRVNSQLVFLFFLLGHIVIIANFLIYGDGNLDKIKLIGPYQVGHKDFHLKHTGIAGSVYYPMDIAEYNSTINLPGRNTKWFRYDDNSLMGVARATADIGKQEHLPAWVFKHMKSVKMFTCQDGKLARDFENVIEDNWTLLANDSQGTDKKMIPIIFLHGLAGSRTSQSGSCRDLASHGYIVFSLDHHDGTAYYS